MAPLTFLDLNTQCTARLFSLSSSKKMKAWTKGTRWFKRRVYLCYLKTHQNIRKSPGIWDYHYRAWYVQELQKNSPQELLHEGATAVSLRKHKCILLFTFLSKYISTFETQAVSWNFPKDLVGPELGFLITASTKLSQQKVPRLDISVAGLGSKLKTVIHMRKWKVSQKFFALI